MIETQSLRFFYLLMLALPLTGMASESLGSSRVINYGMDLQALT
jgi:cytochrome b561